MPLSNVARALSPERNRCFASALCHHRGMKTYHQLSDLQALVGACIGTSDWVQIDQSRIDQFAAVTGDEQWIHVDPVRAAAGIFGTTVAHGFLTLSLLALFGRSAFTVGGIRMSVNYGLNRVRFPAPVPVGSRLRAHYKLQSLEAVDGGVQMITEISIEREGHAKPVCVAEAVVRHYP
jgi:acyl dehydratase